MSAGSIRYQILRGQLIRSCLFTSSNAMIDHRIHLIPGSTWPG
jgi:hypothetical protein